MKQKLTFKIVDWWNKEYNEGRDNLFKNHFIKLLSKKYDIEYSDNPDFIIYSAFGHEHLKYDCVRIFFTAENIRTDWDIADYGIDFDMIEVGDRHCHILNTFFGLYGYEDKLKSRTHNTASRFCGVVVSNGGCTMRTNIFNLLSKYKHVDSGGRWNNNIGAPIGNKIEWLKNYKFNICFENSSYPGYLTEKLFDAFKAGCIPIYWGDTSLRCRLGLEESHFNNNGGGGGSNAYNSDFIIDRRIPKIADDLIEFRINPKSFINAHNFDTLQDLVDEVRRIDNDDNAYMEMLHEPVFLDDFNPIEFYENKLFNFLDSIVSQGRDMAYRRCNGQTVMGRIINLKNMIDTKEKIPQVFQGRNAEIIRDIFEEFPQLLENAENLKTIIKTLKDKHSQSVSNEDAQKIASKISISKYSFLDNPRGYIRAILKIIEMIENASHYPRDFIRKIRNKPL